MSRAEDLFASAAARGINLKATAGAESNTDGPAARRRLSHEEIKRRRKECLGLEVYPTAEGSGSRVHRGRMSVHAELGLSALGLAYMPWLAGCFSICGMVTPDEYALLHRNLTKEALSMAEDEGWPLRIPMYNGDSDFYLEQLGGLVLDAQEHAGLFHQFPQLYWVRAGVSEDIWRTKLHARYLSLHHVYQSWLGTAVRWVQRRQNQDDPVAA